MLFEVRKASKASAPGLDSWEPPELRLMSWDLCAQVAVLYNMIEYQGRWPEGSQHAKAAFLPKVGAEAGKVMSYRPLLIMPVLYSKWAAIRLFRIAPWVDVSAMDTILRVVHDCLSPQHTHTHTHARHTIRAGYAVKWHI